MSKANYIFLLLIFIGGCKHDKKPLGVAVRPENFPSFLVAPQTAYDIQYMISGNVGIIPGAFGLSYLVKDRYPANNTINALHEILSLNGWRKTKYSVLNPKTKISTEWMTVDNKRSYGVRYSMVEDWLNMNNEWLMVGLSYFIKENSQKEILHVDIIYHTTGSNRGKVVDRFLDLHPEEKIPIGVLRKNSSEPE